MGDRVSRLMSGQRQRQDQTERSPAQARSTPQHGHGWAPHSHASRAHVAVVAVERAQCDAVLTRGTAECLGGITARGKRSTQPLDVQFTLLVALVVPAGSSVAGAGQRQPVALSRDRLSTPQIRGAPAPAWHLLAPALPIFLFHSAPAQLLRTRHSRRASFTRP